MSIATSSTTIALLISEIAALTTWYALSDRDLHVMLIGASLGLKAKGVTDPNLELAIVSQKPELFLGTTKGGLENGNTKIHSKESNQ